MEKSDESRTRRDEQRRKYSKVDKRVKDKLVRSPRENGEGQDAQKDLHSRTGRDEKKGNTQEKMERDLQVLGVRRWRELVADRKKWKDIVRQAKASSGSSANGRRRRTILTTGKILKILCKRSTRLKNV